MTRWYFILGLLRDYHGLSYGDNKHGWFLIFWQTATLPWKRWQSWGCKDENFLECISPTESKFSPVGEPVFVGPHGMGRVVSSRFFPLQNDLKFHSNAIWCSKPNSEPSTTIHNHPKITINGWYNPPPNGRFIIGLPTFVRWSAVHRTPVSSLIR